MTNSGHSGNPIGAEAVAKSKRAETGRYIPVSGSECRMGLDGELASLMRNAFRTYCNRASPWHTVWKCSDLRRHQTRKENTPPFKPKHFGGFLRVRVTLESAVS